MFAVGNKVAAVFGGFHSYFFIQIISVVHRVQWKLHVNNNDINY